jgi:hypothetical protein
MKWTRHRRHVAPLNTVAIACLSPSWASDVTRRTPRSPRFTRLRRNAVQEGRSSDGGPFGSDVTSTGWAGTRRRQPLRTVCERQTGHADVWDRLAPEARVVIITAPARRSQRPSTVPRIPPRCRRSRRINVPYFSRQCWFIRRLSGSSSNRRTLACFSTYSPAQRRHDCYSRRHRQANTTNVTLRRCQAAASHTDETIGPSMPGCSQPRRSASP